MSHLTIPNPALTQSLSFKHEIELHNIHYAYPDTLKQLLNH